MTAADPLASTYRRRAKGLGTVEHDPRTGKWAVRLSRAVDPQRRRPPERFDTYEEADRFRAAIALVHADRARAGSAPELVETLAERLGKEEARRKAKGQRNLRTARAMATVWSAVPLAALPVGLLDRDHVQRQVDAWAEDVAREELAPQTVRNRLYWLAASFTPLVKRGTLKCNPCEGVVLDLAKAGRRLRFLSVGEVMALFTSRAIPELWRMWLAASVGAGWRFSEGLLLAEEHVRLGATPEVVIARGNVEGGEVLPPKNGRTRVVPLFGVALLAVERVLAMTDRARVPWRGGGPLVFGGPAGGFASSHVRRQWDAWRSACGLGEDVTPHALRHTCASLLLTGDYGDLLARCGLPGERRRWALAEIRDHLGHAAITTTEIYAHLATSHLHTIAASTAPRLHETEERHGVFRSGGNGRGGAADDRGLDGDPRDAVAGRLGPGGDRPGGEGQRDPRLDAQGSDARAEPADVRDDRRDVRGDPGSGDAARGEPGSERGGGAGGAGDARGRRAGDVNELDRTSRQGHPRAHVRGRSAAGEVGPAMFESVAVPDESERPASGFVNRRPWVQIPFSAPVCGPSDLASLASAFLALARDADADHVQRGALAFAVLGVAVELERLGTREAYEAIGAARALCAAAAGGRR